VRLPIPDSTGSSTDTTTPPSTVNTTQGFLDGIRHIKYANGVIVVESEKSNRVIRFLRSNRANVHSWSIELSEREAEALTDHKSED
jgi:hypothetical protein